MSRLQNVVYLDGSLLDNEEQSSGSSGKGPASGKSATVSQPQRNVSMAREPRQRSGPDAHGNRLNPDERLPSAIAGVSLAPLPDNEVYMAAGADVCNTHINKKRPPRMAIAHGPPGPLRAIGDVPRQGGQQQSSTHELRAEGRALTLAAAHDKSGADAATASSKEPCFSVDLANLNLYAEINGTDDYDSLCGTPPAIAIETIACGGEFDIRGPLGPLSPTPLSPSVLTVTKGNFSLLSPNTEGETCWESGADLPDMRHVVSACASPPALITCASPPLPLSPRLSPPVSSA